MELPIRAESRDKNKKRCRAAEKREYMNEKKKSRKELVKTAAIVFLSVMLVLTFFSNTIMNYSLPEVATQYIQPGSIAAQIRGSGMIESGDPYKVRISGVRKVESVDVYVGDTVEKGQVLMHLSYEDSEALKTARAELEAAQLSYEMALLTGNIDSGIMKNAGSTLSTETYKNNIISLKNAIALAENEVKAAQAKVDELNRWGEALSTQISVTHVDGTDTSAEQAAADAAKAEMDAAKTVLDTANADLEAAKTAWDQAKDNVETAEADLAAAPEDTALQEALNNAKTAEEAAKSNYEAAEVTQKDAQTAYDNKKKEYDSVVAVLNNKTNTINSLASLKAQQDTNTVNLFHANNELNDKKKVLAEKEEALNDYVKNTSDAIDLNTKYQAVADARKKVEDMEKEMAGSDVTAPISGTISEIYVTSGLDTPQDGIVLTMQPEGEGYTLSFSVTNEQARKVSVGEQASLVNSWRYDDLQVILTKIMPDKNDPSQKKLLVFDVEGENVIAGQSLNVSVGQKSANYDMIVPNSAIREDNNGKFILIVESKNSPLGNRYIATRVDVEVIASDDTKSAITGAVYGYEFVITTSTQPVKAGQYVRLSDN